MGAIRIIQPRHPPARKCSLIGCIAPLQPGGWEEEEEEEAAAAAVAAEEEEEEEEEEEVVVFSPWGSGMCTCIGLSRGTRLPRWREA